MLELLDEIGKDHCAAISLLAEPRLDGKLAAGPIFPLPYRNESLTLREPWGGLPPHHVHMAYDDKGGEFRLFLLMSKVVYGQLKDHGLVETVGEFTEFTERGQDQDGNWIERQLTLPRIRLTERGRDFHSRWIFKIMSKYTVKVNRRVLFCVPVVTFVLGFLLGQLANMLFAMI